MTRRSYEHIDDRQATTAGNAEERRPVGTALFVEKTGGVLLSQGISPQVPSALSRLNFRVRDGNGCDPVAMATGNQLSTGVAT